ncbi:hypothetical protein BC835DRAFT_590950 [Cytidiella melzeri]|nr:hypothetical protein BC835DRAFT_590950 [Cytidiella melzeri]
MDYRLVPILTLATTRVVILLLPRRTRQKLCNSSSPKPIFRMRIPPLALSQVGFFEGKPTINPVVVEQHVAPPVTRADGLHHAQDEERENILKFSPRGGTLATAQPFQPPTPPRSRALRSSSQTNVPVSQPQVDAHAAVQQTESALEPEPEPMPRRSSRLRSSTPAPAVPVGQRSASKPRSLLRSTRAPSVAAEEKAASKPWSRSRSLPTSITKGKRAAKGKQALNVNIDTINERNEGTDSQDLWQESPELNIARATGGAGSNGNGERLQVSTDQTSMPAPETVTPRSEIQSNRVQQPPYSAFEQQSLTGAQDVENQPNETTESPDIGGFSQLQLLTQAPYSYSSQDLSA